MGENFLQMLMGMVDSYLVAHLGLIAISGVSVAGNIITIYQAIFLALGAAVASVMSKSLGEKKSRNHCLPCDRVTEGNLTVECSLRRGLRCYLDAR